MPIKSSKTQWRDIVLVCKKCSKKLDGGFGPDGDQSLKKALKRYLKPHGGPKPGKGRKAALAVIETGCFDVCPKGAVVAVNAMRPAEMLIVPAGIDLLEVRHRLGLNRDRAPVEPITEAPVTPLPVARLVRNEG